jgi:hypothetical protein
MCLNLLGRSDESMNILCQHSRRGTQDSLLVWQWKQLAQSYIYTLDSVPWLMWLVDGLPQLRFGFDPRSLHAAFVVDMAVLGSRSISNLTYHYRSTNARYSPSSRQTSLTRRTNGRSLGTLKQALVFRERVALNR